MIKIIYHKKEYGTYSKNIKSIKCILKKKGDFYIIEEISLHKSKMGKFRRKINTDLFNKYVKEGIIQYIDKEDSNG